MTGTSVPDGTAANLGPPPILTIDDDPLARDVNSRRLIAAGYRVLVESDGSAGIRRARAEQSALVICDLHLPLAPSELVILGLRLDPATAGVPILVVSVDPGRLGPELLATIERIIGGPRAEVVS